MPACLGGGRGRTAKRPRADGPTSRRRDGIPAAVSSSVRQPPPGVEAPSITSTFRPGSGQGQGSCEPVRPGTDDDRVGRSPSPQALQAPGRSGRKSAWVQWRFSVAAPRRTDRDERRRSLGQNFLLPWRAEQLVPEAGASPRRARRRDRCRSWRIDPRLARAGAEVIAVEVDPVWAHV